MEGVEVESSIQTHPPAATWKGRDVLVTGAAGFLGSWLCQALVNRGAKVVGLDCAQPSATGVFNRLGLGGRMTLLQGDVTNPEAAVRALADHAVEVVFHTAACTQVSEATRNPRRAYEVNIAGTWNVLEAVRTANAKICLVLASSDAVYGYSNGEPYTENQLPLGTTPYAVSKICAETLACAYAKTYATPIAAARFTNLYGMGDANTSRIIPGTAAAVLEGKPPVIRSNGRAKRDYLFIDDAVDGFLRLAEALTEGRFAGETFNLSSERLVSVLELVRMILRIAGRDDLKPQVVDVAQEDIPSKPVSSAKAHGQLGWFAQVPLEAGLERTMRWDVGRGGTVPT